MKKIVLLITTIIFFCLFFYLNQAGQVGQEIQENQETIQIAVGGKQAKKLPLVLIVLGEKDESLDRIIDVITHDLNFTGQFDITQMHKKEIHKKHEMEELTQAGFNLAVFVEQERKNYAYKLHIYDVSKIKMIKGERFEKKTVHAIQHIDAYWGHMLADFIILELLNNQGLFLSKLAYCKHTKNKHSDLYTLCVANYDGSEVKQLYQTKQIIAGLRWNNDMIDPLLFYSEWTQVNIRLMAITMQGVKSVAIDFDGLNMLPAFSADNKEIVVCLSRNGSSQLYRYGYNKKLKKYGYTRLTFNDGTNICPAILEDGTIIFCSDFENGMPSLYYLHATTGELTRLTHNGACFDPCYNAIGKKILCIKMYQGVEQLMTYDLVTKREKQLTFDPGHKQEGVWSPCGNYIAFAHALTDASNKRIAIEHVGLGKNSRRYITPENVSCSYPAWSSNYAKSPIVI